MGLTPFDIDVTFGQAKVIVDGQDISQRVTRVTVDAAFAEIPKVYVEVYGEGKIVGEGIVHIVKDLDPRQVVLGWLENIDSGALEAAALEKLGGLGGGMSTGEAFLATLKEFASGDDNGA